MFKDTLKGKEDTVKTYSLIFLLLILSLSGCTKKSGPWDIRLGPMHHPTQVLEAMENGICGGIGDCTPDIKDD